MIGGTGLLHMETMARSKQLYGPYEPNPSNPILSNANTTEYCKCYYVDHHKLANVYTKSKLLVMRICSKTRVASGGVQLWPYVLVLSG